MNIYDLFLKKAKEAGIDPCEIGFSMSSSNSISLYHGEVEGVETNKTCHTSIRGIYNGKMGFILINKITKGNIDQIIEDIKNNAKVIEKDEKPIIFKGSKKYRKINTYNPKLKDIPFEDKKKLLFELEKAAYEKDKRITDVESVSFAEGEGYLLIYNSYGLKLKQKGNDFTYSISIVAEENGDKKTNYDFYIGNNFDDFLNKKDNLIERLTKEGLEKLGGQPIKSGKTKIVLSPECVSSLLDYYLPHCIAEKVQKHTSLFEGKLHQQIASKKLTVQETPLNKTIFAKWFDDEGVATYNKYLFKNGVLQTYLYNLETAAKDGVESTGNGYNTGSKIVTDINSVVVKPGKKTQEQLFEQVKNGLYITNLKGMNSGINSQSGNFSLPCEGFEIVDGKKGNPVSLITVAGNIMEVFRDIIEVGCDSKVSYGGTSTPSMYIKSLNITGK